MGEENTTNGQFWKSILIYVKKSHLVNRRLSNSIDVVLCQTADVNNIKEIVNTLKSLSPEHISSAGICDEIKCSPVSWQRIEECLANSLSDTSAIFICLQTLVSRCENNENVLRLSILDTKNLKVTFENLSSTSSAITPNFRHSIICNQGFQLTDTNDVNKLEPSFTWLEKTLLPRLGKWSKLEDNISQNKAISQSLNLVDKAEYQVKYNELKLKYGINMVKIWPESTDPKKFVYEDVAIATYLLLFWKNERKLLNTEKMQSFVDLGCGNGLLVYILCSEGHMGKGIDVRKRKIWDLYPEFVTLEIATVSPSDDSLYKSFDWLIGNHSDELSPWIPVFALRSSFKCKYFLLPCCAYEFDGSKYQRKNSSLSQYNEYLKYIETISLECGFETHIDRLKIPSTKRICLIGSNRKYSQANHHSQKAKVQQFIENECLKSNIGFKLDEQWEEKIKTRESVEKVRNCTQVDKDVVSNMVFLVVNHLLQTKNYLNNWNAGAVLPLNEVVKLISTENLKKLKSECGGLQTLLRNNHNIFEVVKGSVKLKYPITKTDATLKKNNTKKIKITFGTKRCWFFENHPDKCPLSSEDCCYAHVLKKY